MKLRLHRGTFNRVKSLTEALTPTLDGQWGMQQGSSISTPNQISSFLSAFIWRVQGLSRLKYTCTYANLIFLVYAESVFFLYRVYYNLSFMKYVPYHIVPFASLQKGERMLMVRLLNESTKSLIYLSYSLLMNSANNLVYILNSANNSFR